jgi:acyl carrier protein
MTAALSEADLARLRRQGITPLSSAEGLALLDEALDRDEPALVPAKLTLAKAAPPRASTAAKPKAANGHATLGRRLAGLAPAEQRSRLLDLVRTEAGAIFRLPSHAVPDDQPLQSLGLDSLTAVELRDRLGKRLETSLPATLAFDHPTPGHIARFVATLLAPSNGAAVAPVDPDAAVRRALATVPLDALRRQGLLHRLLRLGDETGAGMVGPAGDPRAIEQLSNEELVTLIRSL